MPFRRSELSHLITSSGSFCPYATNTRFAEMAFGKVKRKKFLWTVGMDMADERCIGVVGSEDVFAHSAADLEQSWYWASEGFARRIANRNGSWVRCNDLIVDLFVQLLG
ncbi:hypothetical protein AC578_637 [Pseudocercospora eumusae]|uniref:Uncharacterized protein n=1 Tax=Pseudocercospora eumusae TaxID=321146 RepID=A0A139HKR5_9PEZI|nr:hypothetical protein AC578_637 [Pseudocercospora eumusae]